MIAHVGGRFAGGAMSLSFGKTSLLDSLWLVGCIVTGCVGWLVGCAVVRSLWRFRLVTKLYRLLLTLVYAGLMFSSSSAVVYKK
jgi:hypothetical protein